MSAYTWHQNPHSTALPTETVQSLTQGRQQGAGGEFELEFRANRSETLENWKQLVGGCEIYHGSRCTCMSTHEPILNAAADLRKRPDCENKSNTYHESSLN
ncbi:hypothetical protein PoB_000556400 [Plakobranchus ocellatus]|uniref:Uncharacterized protein n=1 Tax=Plakobranchus ocellatus TaxID=259542 RepID=A0AAV3YAH2_9GAST|nr:hypothetical protein PoB_000556400 [Plakobranchus ocellatus]